MIRKEITQHVYSIEMAEDVFLDMLNRDKNYSETPYVDRLMKIDGVSKVEYDGHFGPYVFLTVDVEDDTEETWSKIRWILE